MARRRWLVYLLPVPLFLVGVGEATFLGVVRTELPGGASGFLGTAPCHDTRQLDKRCCTFRHESLLPAQKAGSECLGSSRRRRHRADGALVAVRRLSSEEGGRPVGALPDLRSTTAARTVSTNNREGSNRRSVIARS